MTCATAVVVGALLLQLVVLSNCNTVHLQPISSCQDCTSLDEALSLLESADTLSLSPGTYTLHDFSADVVRDLSNVTIVGNILNPQTVIITCDENVGLFFFNMTDLTIAGVTVKHCGIKGVNRIDEIMNITKEIIDVLYTPLSDFSTAIYLAHCPNLQISSVIIRDNRGFGLVGINLVGNVTFTQLQVYQNYPSKCVLDLERQLQVGGSGGGMFLLYQNYLELETEHENGSEIQSRDLETHFDFTDSNITDNFICRLKLLNVLHNELPLSIDHPPTLNLSMIGAGGLTFALAQSDYPVQANFDSCLFRNNSGTYNGAAMHIAHFEQSSNSHVFIEGSQFLDNGGHLIEQYREKGIGPAGALHIWYYMPNPLNFVNVDLAVELLYQQPCSVTVYDSVFEGNVARSGGAVYVLSFGGEVGLIQDLLTLNTCRFSHNRGDTGGALYFSELSYSGFKQGLGISLQSVEITSNDKLDISPSNSLQPESGIIGVSFLNISLNGSNIIANNSNTAMSLHSAIITISGDTFFAFNTGSTGGAIALSSESYLLLAGFTNVTFYRNNALIAGGAIFVNFGATRFNNYDCFVLFAEIDFFCNLEGCDTRPVFATFIDNTAPLGSAIYGSTLSNCPWANGTFESRSNFTVTADEIFDSITRSSLHATIRPFLNSGDLTIINTLPRAILPMDNEDNFVIIPGQEIELALGAFDQLDQPVPLTIFAQLTPSYNARASIGNSNRYLIDGTDNFTTVPLKVFGIQNTTYRVSITSNEAQVEFSFNVTLTECPLGYIYNYNSSTCLCDPRLISLDDTIVCESDGNVTFPSEMWLGYLAKRDGFALQICGFDHCISEVNRIAFDNPDTQCRSNRSGILCGGCKVNYSRVIGTSRCLLCENNDGLALILVFAILGILLVVAVAIFNITIAHGYINGVIFCCNILSLVISFEEIIIRANFIRFVISLLNLNFGIESCFYDGMTALQLSILSLIFPLYLGAILLAITLVFKYCHSKYLAKLLTKLNITHIFATLLLLAYPSIIRNSIDLLGFVSIHVNGEEFTKWQIDPNQDYFAGLHIFGFFLAAIFLVILILLPLLLLCPRFSLRLPVVRRLKPLIDSFTAPLAEGKEFWVGFRLQCRNFFYTLILVDENILNSSITIFTFLMLITLLEAYIKPFKSAGRNLFDLHIMINLTLIYFQLMLLRFDRDLDVAQSIGLLLILLVACEVVILFLLYIAATFPCTRKLMKKAQTKLKSLHLKIKNAYEKYAFPKEPTPEEAPRESVNNVTRTSVHVTQVPVRDNFHSTMYVGYRESLFDQTATEDISI